MMPKRLLKRLLKLEALWAGITGTRRLGAMPCSAWTPITDRLPTVGDNIACAAEHCEGGMMLWAGTVTEIWEQGFAVMETRGERTRSFIITEDTLWTHLPSLPNVQGDSRRAGSPKKLDG